jgi:hypothetical protein
MGNGPNSPEDPPRPAAPLKKPGRTIADVLRPLEHAYRHSNREHVDRIAVDRARELREHAVKVRTEAAKQREQGRGEEADALDSQARRLEDQAAGLPSSLEALAAERSGRFWRHPPPAGLSEALCGWLIGFEWEDPATGTRIKLDEEWLAIVKERGVLDLLAFSIQNCSQPLDPLTFERRPDLAAKHLAELAAEQHWLAQDAQARGPDEAGLLHAFGGEAWTAQDHRDLADQLEMKSRAWGQQRPRPNRGRPSLLPRDEVVAGAFSEVARFYRDHWHDAPLELLVPEAVRAACEGDSIDFRNEVQAAMAERAWGFVSGGAQSRGHRHRRRGVRTAEQFAASVLAGIWDVHPSKVRKAVRRAAEAGAKPPTPHPS